MPLQLWRLFREAHGPGLDGIGGLQAAGRWHDLGTRVVYFGATAAIVVLEKLAHIDPAVLPADLILARYAGDLSVEEILPGEVTDRFALTQTRARGAKFMKDRKACVLRVPSIVVPEEHNFVFNPLHPDASKIAPVDSRRFTFDERLLG
jgi:RES domain-containing protein